MSVGFEDTGERIVLAQRRRGLRRVAAGIVGLWLTGGLVRYWADQRELPTTLDCDHERGVCTLKTAGRTTEIDVASLTGASLEQHATRQTHAAWIALHRREHPGAHKLCGSRDDPAAVAAAQVGVAELTAFIVDPGHAPVHLQCQTRRTSPPRYAVVMTASLLGWCVVFLVLAQFSHEIEVVLDRRAGTISVRGRAWLRRSWQVARPLADVARIDVRDRYAQLHEVVAVFVDGTEALLCSPVIVTPARFEQHVAALRALVGPSRA